MSRLLLLFLVGFVLSAISTASAAPPHPATGKVYQVTLPVYVSIIDIIHDRADFHGVERDLLRRMAEMESMYDVQAVGADGELGLFQLHPRGLLPYFYRLGYRDPFDPYESADFTARMIVEGRGSHWTSYRNITKERG